jgi:transcriptional regulator with XRE-family HTH domain
VPRPNSTEDARHLSADQRAERRKRVLKMLASVTQDAGHQRQMFRATVGGQLAALVGRSGLSAAKVARKLNISRSQLSRQLAGDANLTLNSLHDIAQAAGAAVQLRFEAAQSAANNAAPVITQGHTQRRDTISGEFELSVGAPAVAMSRLVMHHAVIQRRHATEASFVGLGESSPNGEFDAANEPGVSVAPPRAVLLG